MKNELTVYISTCDSNMFILKYFQYFFKKYWGTHMKVKILGFNPPDFDLNENIEFISLGTEQVNGAKGWSNYLIDYFNSIDDDFFIFGIDDFMVARPVDIEVFEICKKLLDQNIGRVDLQPLQYSRNPKHFKHFKKIDDVNFIVLNQSGNGECIYQNAGAFSIWNRKWFLKNIQRDWSPWDWELIGSSLAENDGFNVISSVDRWSIRKVELLSNAAWPGVINTRGIRDIDIIEMEKLKNKNDRVIEYKNIMDERWGYYDYCGSDWVNKIFGD